MLIVSSGSMSRSNTCVSDSGRSETICPLGVHVAMHAYLRSFQRYVTRATITETGPWDKRPRVQGLWRTLLGATPKTWCMKSSTAVDRHCAVVSEHGTVLHQNVRQHMSVGNPTMRAPCSPSGRACVAVVAMAAPISSASCTSILDQVSMRSSVSRASSRSRKY